MEVLSMTIQASTFGEFYYSSAFAPLKGNPSGPVTTWNLNDLPADDPERKRIEDILSKTQKLKTKRPINTVGEQRQERRNRACTD